MQRKTEVLTVRVTPEFKKALKKAAARERRSQANFLENLVFEYCEARKGSSRTSEARTSGARSS
jgi:uncharacterized protein (DUF1778 family)